MGDKITTNFERASDGTGRTLYLAYKGDRALPMTHWAVDEACCLTAARGPLTALTGVSFHQFDTEAEAVAYRAEQGCGGWIFVCHDKGQATIFPHHMTPKDVLRHPLTSSQGGRLIGQTGQTLKSYEVAE